MEHVPLIEVKYNISADTIFITMYYLKQISQSMAMQCQKFLTHRSCGLIEFLRDDSIILYAN